MLSIIFTFFCLFTLYTVNGRTCTCAQFIEDSCNAQQNCEWNTRETVGDIAKNVKGICRSSQWMECHKDEMCSIVGRREMAIERSLEAEQALEAEEEAAPSSNKRRLSEVLADEGNFDWPYNCISGEYHEDAAILDVRPYQLLAFKAAGYEIQTAVIKDGASISGQDINILSFGMMIKFASIITFCCLISFAVCYKFKEPSYYKSIVDTQWQDNYATFN